MGETGRLVPKGTGLSGVYRRFNLKMIVGSPLE